METTAHDNSTTAVPGMTPRMHRRYFNKAVESMARAEISELQSRKLHSQLSRAWQSPFYQQRFEAAGLSPDDPVQPEELTALPVTRKEDLCDDVAEHPPYGSRLTVEPHQVVRVVETSGTSGKGKEVHVSTRTDLDRIVEMESAGFVWAGVELGTVVAFTIPITLTAASSYWDLALQALDANVLRLGHLSTNEKLRYMTRYGAELLIATPTYLGWLEHAASEMGIDPTRDLNTVRSISVAGDSEVGSLGGRTPAGLECKGLRTVGMHPGCRGLVVRRGHGQ